MTTIELSDEVMHRLERLAAMRDTSVSDALAEAIGLYEAAVTAENGGGRLLIEDGSRKLTKISPGLTRRSSSARFS